MTLGQRVQERRIRLALTQQAVARDVGVSRELVALWESGERSPSLRQVEELALALRVNAAYLVGEAELPPEHDWVALFRGANADDNVGIALRRWARFLDEWAAFLQDDLGEVLPGPGKPPRALAERELVQDARRAPRLAEKARAQYALGQDAMPDLFTFLDEHDVLVMRMPLGGIGRGNGGVSGAFFNHERLGYCVLVNSSTSPGRQAFTLAHEFAHALYHYGAGGILCRDGDIHRLERFADSFAAHFLVPGKELRRRLRDHTGADEPDPYQVLALASYFGVSYAMMLVRLRQERLLSEGAFQDHRMVSPSALARHLGINPSAFSRSQPTGRGLDRFPISVLAKTAAAIHEDQLTPGQAAELLDVDLDQVRSNLLRALPPADARELHEYDELPA